MLWILVNVKAYQIVPDFPPCFNHQWLCGRKQMKAYAPSRHRGGASAFEMDGEMWVPSALVAAGAAEPPGDQK